MPDIIRDAPVPGSFRYVLVRWDWSPTQTYLVANYGESKKSRVIDWPESWRLPRGRTPNTPTREKPATNFAFVVDRHLRDRAIRLGWQDVTERWYKLLGYQNGRPDPVEIGAPPPGGDAVVASIGVGAARPRGLHAIPTTYSGR